MWVVLTPYTAAVATDGYAVYRNQVCGPTAKGLRLWGVDSNSQVAANSSGDVRGWGYSSTGRATVLHAEDGGSSPPTSTRKGVSCI